MINYIIIQNWILIIANWNIDKQKVSRKFYKVIQFLIKLEWSVITIFPIKISGHVPTNCKNVIYPKRVIMYDK